MREIEPIWLNPFSGGYIIMTHELWDIIYSYNRGNDSETEAGGIFSGRYRGPHIEIMDCSEPLRKDVRSRFSFFRRDPGHSNFAMRAWKRGGHVDTFVGEWHTHPTPIPVPSVVDRQSWHRLTNSTGLNMFFLILGYTAHWAGIAKPSRHKNQLKRAIQLFRE